MGFKETLQNTPFEKIVKYLSLGVGATLTALGVATIILATFSLSPTSVVSGIYLTIGGVMTFLGELGFAWYYSRISFQEHHFGRGVFFIVVATLAFTMCKLNPVFLIISYIVSALSILLGVLHMGYSFFEAKYHKKEPNVVVTDAYGSTGTSSFPGDEAKRAAFDPVNYSDFKIGDVASPYDPVHDFTADKTQYDSV